MKQDTILVVGAAGTIGSELTRLLKEAGHEVRATTNRPVEKADQVQVNLATGEGLKQAFEGVDRAFFLSPAGFADQYSVLSPLIQEAKRRGLQKVVLMTAMGANAVETSPFRRAEIELEKSGLNYNIIRPNWFLQNFNTFWRQGIREHGKIQLPAGDAKTSFIDARDISAVAARLLTDDSLTNRAFDLSGPRAVTHAEVAEAISRVKNAPVRYENIEPSVLKNGLVAAGLPVGYVDFLILIFGFLREGYNSRIEASVKEILGREPRSLEQYAADFKHAWL